jgi:signal transduction histidine kinase
MDAEMMHSWHSSTLEPGQRTTVSRMYQTAGRMNALIEDLLEMSRVDRGALALAVRDVAMNRLLDEAADMLRPLVESSGLALRVQGCTGGTRVPADDGRVLQVIANLVGNAVKFTPAPGTVHLSADVGGGECLISVRDTGPGIPPDQLPHLFGSFWQARDADRRGLGLGLAIAQGIVQAHGGRIWAESEPGRGTTFTFSLPLRAELPPPGRMTPITAALPSLNSP